MSFGVGPCSPVSGTAPRRACQADSRASRARRTWTTADPSGEEQSTRDLSITPVFSPELAAAANMDTAKRSAEPWRYSSQSAVSARLDSWNKALCHHLVSMPVINLFAEEMASGFVA